MLSMSIPLSGMQAASLRLTAAADNIANVNPGGTPPAAGQTSATPQGYQPVQVQQSSAGPMGGTTASVTGVSPAAVTQYDPSSPYANSQGLTSMPNVDVMNEIVNIATARVDFAINLKVADAVNQMVKQLFELGD